MKPIERAQLQEARQHLSFVIELRKLMKRYGCNGISARNDDGAADVSIDFPHSSFEYKFGVSLDEDEDCFRQT